MRVYFFADITYLLHKKRGSLAPPALSGMWRIVDIIWKDDRTSVCININARPRKEFGKYSFKISILTG
jgi:hypothetical protein